ncbi:MAG: hypothetical protein SFX73_09480, partial [Kofleriaceae bacterium]|nr:hypothetical protein [Kofleriaceae bacterium]
SAGILRSGDTTENIVACLSSVPRMHPTLSGPDHRVDPRLGFLSSLLERASLATDDVREYRPAHAAVRVCGFHSALDDTRSLDPRHGALGGGTKVTVTRVADGQPIAFRVEFPLDVDQYDLVAWRDNAFAPAACTRGRSVAGAANAASASSAGALVVLRLGLQRWGGRAGQT